DEDESSDSEEEEEEHLALTVPAPALYSSVSTSKETKPFEEGETAATPPPFGYRIAARISVQPHILMPFCLESEVESESIPEADIQLRKRARFTTPTGGYKVGESSVAAAARQIRPALTIADRRRADDRLIGRLRREGRYFRTLYTTYTQEVAHSRDYCTQIIDYYQSREVHTSTLVTQIEALQRDVSTLQRQHIDDEDRLTRHIQHEHAQRDVAPEDGDKMAPKRTTRSTQVPPVTPAPTATTTIVTKAQLQALINQGVAAAMAKAEASRVRNGYGSNGLGPRLAQVVRECTYLDFLKCQPLNFKGTEGVIELTQWSRSYMVKLPCEDCYSGSCSGISMENFEENDDRHCPRGEIKKLETEMWELKTKGTYVIGYSLRFQELALMCDRTFLKESDRIKKYIGGLPDTIHDSVKATKPKTMQEAIKFATELMDKRICDVVENKRKFEGTSGNNQNQPSRIRGRTLAGPRAYAAGNSDRNMYTGSKPLCSKCDYYHEDYIPGPEYPEYLPPADDVLPAKEQPLPVAVSPITESPGYIMKSEPEMEPEDKDGDDEKSEEDSIEYLTSGGDDDADDDGDDLSEDDADDEDEEESSDSKEEEEDHIAPTVPAPALYSSVSVSEETEPFEEGETTATPPPFGYRVAARISVQPHILMPFCSKSERARFTTPTGGYEVGESSVTATARQIRPALTIADRCRADDRLIGRLRRERRYFRTLSTTYAQEKMAPKRTTRLIQVLPVTPASTATTTTVTEAQLQALIDQGVAAAMAESEASRVRNGYDSNGSGPRLAQAVRECTYPDFLKCQPLNFEGTEGGSDSLNGVALTWWNSHVKTVTLEVAQALPWKTLKKMITDKYCPRDEIKKLEFELWEVKTKGTDVIGYSRRFQDLALMCDRTFPEESDRVEKYIGGVPDMIHDSVKAAKPKTMQEAIEFATELMDKRIRDAVENKQKFEGTFGNNQYQP
nr:hypothetical protein [Tanacetum cinerariifolium]